MLLHQPLQLGRVSIPNRVFLAPMSGVTDEPFRVRAHQAGAGLVVTEMIASGELVKMRGDTAQRMRRPDIPVHMVQLAGRDASALAEAARIAEGEGADIIDINMGCPAKKVTGGYCGSALMREPDHAIRLIASVVEAVKLPVTVKMRLGWDETSLNAPHIASRAEQAGVRMVTVHGRTRCQFYEGRADWRAIRRVREAVTVPLVANGDVASPADAQAILDQSGADAVMVGRATYGAPWLPGEVACGGCQKPADMASYVVEHYQDMLRFHGEQKGLRQARKHLGWYLDNHAPHTAPELRSQIMTSLDPFDVATSLRAAFAPLPEKKAA
ncbi:tRNA dihydrouridine synthase DusB [Mesorhizobium sp. RP14(2022)]|uniref:tRNA-dihydrouridine synthase n=1 Tax=Mesorhizobium liriopis TaxID=2953882 RepID=A0ABT1C6W7_9HYPH|nr:tRNA dihydrouridine synthase DusB [Mesorhizobium liriopis]MCO6050580.1 tRNA dihydrouridine synthase DusB [Mesorhizobium liriopis]